MHKTVEPSILYFGTPVALIGSENEDGSANLAPISSAWWLGWNCVLGFGARSHTPQNLLRTGECTINLPSVDQVAEVDALARTTGSDPVPPHKVAMGYRSEPDKFACAGLTPMPSLVVRPPRVAQCPVQMEGVVVHSHAVGRESPEEPARLLAIEVRIVRVHVEESLLRPGTDHRIDPLAWRPLMMSFCQFFGLGEILHPSRLAEIPESAYTPPHLLRARAAQT